MLPALKPRGVQCQGQHQKLSPKRQGLGRPVRPRNRSKAPKEDLGKRSSRTTGNAAALTKAREFEHSRWERRVGERRRGVPTQPTFANGVEDGRKCFTEQICLSPLARVVGPGIIRPETNAPHWVQRAGFSQKVVASAQKLIFHGGILREFGMGAS